MNKKNTRIALTKEMKVLFLRALKDGFIEVNKLDVLLNRNSAIEIDEDKLKQIEQILYPD